MHIPDGFLNTSASASLIATVGVISVYALAKIRKTFFKTVKNPVLKTPEGAEFGGGATTTLTRKGQDKIFKMATVGAFIFAAQMINFPVTAGTSGHLLGGVLAAVLLGPLEGMIVIAVVLVVQSLFFADGGLIALGANIFNMGVVAAIGGYYFYELLKKYLKKALLAAFITAWLSVVAAALVTSIELAVSGTIPLGEVLPAMVGVHALIGIGEGVVTILVLLFMKQK